MNVCVNQCEFFTAPLGKSNKTGSTLTNCSGLVKYAVPGLDFFLNVKQNITNRPTSNNCISTVTNTSHHL